MIHAFFLRAVGLVFPVFPVACRKYFSSHFSFRTRRYRIIHLFEIVTYLSSSSLSQKISKNYSLGIQVAQLGSILMGSFMLLNKQGPCARVAIRSNWPSWCTWFWSFTFQVCFSLYTFFIYNFLNLKHLHMKATL